jgi:hypothetical protein
VSDEDAQDHGLLWMQLRAQAGDQAGSKALRDRVTELEFEVAGLKTALESRTVIAQAVGMIMLALPASEATAFNVLAYISQSTNTKMRVLSESICDHVSKGRGLPPEVADQLSQALGPRQYASAVTTRRLRAVPSE